MEPKRTDPFLENQEDVEHNGKAVFRFFHCKNELNESELLKNKWKYKQQKN